MAIKRVVAGLFMAAMAGGAAQAVRPTFPYGLTNDIIANVNQVSADSANVTMSFAPLASLSFTGNAKVTVTRTVQALTVSADSGATKFFATAAGSVGYFGTLSASREVGQSLDLPIDELQIGFIAREVEAVVPEAVAPPKNGSEAHRA